MWRRLLSIKLLVLYKEGRATSKRQEKVLLKLPLVSSIHFRMIWNWNKVFNVKRRVKVLLQVKKQPLLTESEMVYMKVLDISKKYMNITNSIVRQQYAEKLIKELLCNILKRYRDAARQNINLLEQKGKPVNVVGSFGTIFSLSQLCLKNLKNRCSISYRKIYISSRRSDSIK